MTDQNATARPLSGGHGVLVAAAGLCAHLFFWASDQDRAWYILLTQGRMPARATESFFIFLGGFMAGAFALWCAAAGVARWRAKAASFTEGLALTAPPYRYLLLFALAPLLAWSKGRGPFAFLVETAVLALFASALSARLGFTFFDFAGPARSLWRRPAPYAAALILLFSMDRMLAGFWRHLSFNSNIDDLGFYDQLLWGLRNGLGFWNTIYGNSAHNFLAEHIMPSIVLLLPAYWVWASPLVLYIAQTGFLTGGAVALWAVARKRAQAAWFPLAAVMAWLLYSPIERGWVIDFHLDAVEAGLYITAYWLLVTRRAVAYWVVIACLLGCKEDVGLYVATLGVWFAVFERRWKTGLATAVVGLSWSLVMIAGVMPYLANGDQNRQIAIYGHLGDSIGDIALTFLIRPHVVLHHLLVSDRPDSFVSFRLESLFKVMVPLAFISCWRPSTLLLLIPPTVTTILSGWEPQYALRTHYGLVFAGPAFVGLIEGWRALELRKQRNGAAPEAISAWAVALLVCSLASNIEYARFPVKQPLKWSRVYRIPDYRRGVVNDVFAKIPPDARVAADNYIGAQLAHRQWIFKLPPARPDVEFVVINVRNVDPDARPAVREAAGNLFLKQDFGIIQRVEGVILMRKGAHAPDERLHFQYLSEKLSRTD